MEYPAVGQCIYCGTKEQPLRPEHIIPLALNGDLILLEASCQDCADITGGNEGYNTQKLGVFGHPTRHSTGMRSRKKSKWPKTLPLTIKILEGLEVIHKVPIADFPASISLPILPQPRVLLGEPDDGRPVPGTWWTLHQQEKLNAYAEKKGLVAGTRVITGTVHPSRFRQMLAKIAHGAAVATYGIDGFTHMAVDLALCRSESINYLTGCSPVEPQPPPKEDRLHSIRFRGHGAGHPLIVEIRLFANLGAPRYCVVVGLKKD